MAAVVADVALRREDGQSLAALVWRFPAPVVAASTASVGGGLGLRDWVLNVQVSHGYSRTDIDAHARDIADLAGLAGAGVGMFTAVDVRSRHSADEDGALVVATVGVTDPAWAASPTGAAAPPRHGTINVVVQIPARLDGGGLVNLVATIAEAKAQALAEQNVRGTGTPSDAITVLCPADGPADRFGGPRSRWGWRAAVAAHRAVTAALAPGASR